MLNIVERRNRWPLLEGDSYHCPCCVFYRWMEVYIRERCQKKGDIEFYYVHIDRLLFEIWCKWYLKVAPYASDHLYTVVWWCIALGDMPAYFIGVGTLIKLQHLPRLDGRGWGSDMFVCTASSAKVKRIAFVRTVFHLSIVWWREASNDIHALETASWSIASHRGPPRYVAVSLLSMVDKLWYFHGWATHNDYQLWYRQTWPNIMAMHNLMFKTAQFGSVADPQTTTNDWASTSNRCLSPLLGRQPAPHEEGCFDKSGGVRWSLLNRKYTPRTIAELENRYL